MIFLKRALFFVILAILAGGVAFSQGPIKAVPGATGTPLTSDPHQFSAYPRLVRLAHGEKSDAILASVSPGIFYESTDEGNSFTEVGHLPTIKGITSKCCGTLYEMPQQVGALRAGTLLFAGSFCSGADETTASIEVFASTDGGRLWTHHSTPVQRGKCNSNDHDGLWEPEFEVDARDALVMFWSDETDSCCSQKLAQLRSVDGVTWKDERNTVASAVNTDRPGMAVVSKLPSGMYFMSYELCGPAACTVFSRTSSDGWHFGDPADTGTKIQAASGEFFEHAPTNRWVESSQDREGELLLVGQYLMDPSGHNAPGSGKVIFVNHSADASGAWEIMPAPVKVNMAPYFGVKNYNVCANYSSALLPIEGGSSLLEVATAPTSLSNCTAYFAKQGLERR